MILAEFRNIFSRSPKKTDVAPVISDKAHEQTNTDLPEHRLARARNQYDFEQNRLPETFGRTFIDRFIIVRAGIFKGFADVSGEDYQTLLRQKRLISDKRPVFHDEFLPSDEAAEAVAEPFSELVDNWFNTIKAVEPEADRVAMTIRMMSTIFVCGVLLHPTRDGNGQTFKEIIVSYMHDLLPTQREIFIPIKYSTASNTSETDMAVPFMGGGMNVPDENFDLVAGSVPPIDPEKYDEEVHAVISAVQTINFMYLDITRNETDFAKQDAQISEKITPIIEKLSKQIGTPEIAQGIISRYETGKWGKKQPIYLPKYNSFLRQASNYLQQKGLPSEQISVTIYGGNGQKSERASYALRQLLGTEQGQTILNNYVLQNEVKPELQETIPDKLFRKVLTVLETQRNAILVTLESKEQHNARHKQLAQGD